MASKYWLKLYHEMLDDPKVARLPDSSYRRFIECLLLAGETDKNGILPPIEDMAWRLRIDETSLSQDMSRLALAGLVELKEGGRWFVTSFQRRQAAVTTSERVKRHRERKKKQEYNELGNADETKRYTDTDTDKKRLEENKYENIFIHPDPEPIAAMKTALSKITKTSLEFNPDEYDKAAYALIGWEAEPDDVDGFLFWWKTNGYYHGKPSIKSIVGEWTNYQPPPETTAPQVELTAVRQDDGSFIYVKDASNGQNR